MNSVQGGGLPSEYQEVEWIGNTTGQEYFDTNYYPNNKTFVDYEIAITEAEAYDRQPFGVYSGNNQITQFTNISSGKGFAFHLSFSSNNFNDTTWIIQNIQLDTFYSIQLQLGNMGVTVNDVSYRLSEYTFADTMYIFRCKNRTQLGGKIKFKKFDIYEDNELVRNFVPCYRKADQVIGMYDTVTQTFFTNSGSGAFIKGSDV